MKTIWLLLIFIGVTSISHATELTILTKNGYVTFEAGDDWRVLSAQTKMPIASMAFQIFDPVDEETPDSTNVAVMLYDTASPEGQKAIKTIGKPYGQQNKVVVSKYESWKTYEQQANQNNTTYTILDAVSEIADVNISIRLAWPNLKGHRPNHGQEMRQIFVNLLTSVHGGIGKFTPKPGAVIRRPMK